jgi:pilus assembly protein Flp/PilA
MILLSNLILNLKIWSDSRGQDVMEYALAAGFVAGVVVALSPSLGSSLVNIFAKVALELQATGGTGSPTT